MDYGKLISEDQFFLIAGPCVAEDQGLVTEIASEVKSLCSDLGINYVFKASYKKANRSSIHSYTGPGDETALLMLEHVKSSLNIPVTTDIHTVEEAESAAKVVDILQIPAFLCRQTDLLVAAAETGKIVNVKKGQFMSPIAMSHAVDKINRSGNIQVLLTERGTTFGYQDLVVDYRSIPIMKEFAPVVLDCTHSIQTPNQESGVTGGQPRFISTIASAGIAAGVNGLFIETHPRPDQALSDGANMLPLRELPALLHRLVKIRAALKGN